MVEAAKVPGVTRNCRQLESVLAWKRGVGGSKDKQFLLLVLLGTTLWKSKFFPLNSVVSQRAYIHKVISVPRLMLFLNLFNFGLAFYPSRQSILYSLT